MAKKGSYVYLWCEISNAFLSSTVQLFYNLLERPVFVVCVFFLSNKEETNRNLPLTDMVSAYHKSDWMTNRLFCLLFLFLRLMFLQRSFDPANLMDPHHKHLPPEDVFITLRLDARPLRGSTATDKLDSYQQGQRGQQTLLVKCLKPSGFCW